MLYRLGAIRPGASPGYTEGRKTMTENTNTLMAIVWSATNPQLASEHPVIVWQPVSTGSYTQNGKPVGDVQYAIRRLQRRGYTWSPVWA